MKKRILSLALALAFGIPISGTLAYGAQRQVKRAIPKIVSAVCPVMGTKIPDITKSAGKTVYKGKTYYFCCGMCKPAFDEDPAKYVKQEIAR